METKELIRHVRGLIKQEEELNIKRKEKDADWQVLCKEGGAHGARYDAYRAKWKGLPWPSSFHMSGINPCRYGGPEFNYVTGLYCLLAHLRGRQHIWSARIAGNRQVGDNHEYTGDGVMVVVRVSPNMYKEFCDKVLAKLFPAPPAPKPVDKPTRALSLFAKEMEEKGVEGIPEFFK